MNSKTMVLIADSGSTKTAWRLKSNGVVVDSFNTCGVNPSVQSVEEIEQVFSGELMPHVGNPASLDKIFFYGAGCTPQRCGVVTDVFRNLGFSNASFVVASDMLGAAIAVCGNKPGIVGILGTGSNSCQYDGEKIISNTPSLGFILGDEGGGAYIGKRLVGDCLKGMMPEHICRVFVEETGMDVATIVQKVYRESAPNRFLAGLSRFCADHLDEPEIRLLLVDCFEQYFKRNILKYENSSRTVHLIGSIAEIYKEQVVEAAENCNLRIGQILRMPIEGLAEQLN